MKVLHVITISGIGGAEKLLVDLAKEQSKLNISVSCLFFYHTHAHSIAYELGNNLETFGISVTYKEAGNIFSRKILKFIRTFLSLNEFHIIHSHLKHSDIWLSLLKWRKQISIPVVATLHGYRDAYHNQYGLTWNKKAKFSFYFWITKFVCKQLDLFIAISNGVSDLFITSGLLKKEKISIVYHGVEVGPAQTSEIKAGKQFNYNLVIIGRLVPFKGHCYAFEALAILKQKYPKISLHIYGIGEYEHELKRKVKELGLNDQVFFHGFESDIKRKIKEHDIAVVPSIGEPFGMVFLEAFKAGLPVVAFDLPAGNEIIEHGVNGLLAKPLDIIDLKNQIEKLINNRELYDYLSVTAQSILINKFNIEKMATKYLQIYRSIMK